VTTQRERATVSEQIYDPHPMQERAFDRLKTPSSVSPLTSTTPTAAKPPATAKPPSHSRRAERIWPPELTGAPSGFPPSRRGAQSSAIGSLGRMTQVDSDQLAALQGLPAASGHVEVLEADPAL
jgi:hypothetical protein